MLTSAGSKMHLEIGTRILKSSFISDCAGSPGAGLAGIAISLAEVGSFFNFQTGSPTLSRIQSGVSFGKGKEVIATLPGGSVTPSSLDRVFVRLVRERAKG